MIKNKLDSLGLDQRKNDVVHTFVTMPDGDKIDFYASNEAESDVIVKRDYPDSNIVVNVTNEADKKHEINIEIGEY